MMPSPKSLAGTTLDGRYEIVRLIGEGGMGVVYEARHTLIGRKLAIKVIHPDMAGDPEVVQRFHNEARIAAEIGHENIIEVTDMGALPSGAPFIVMEYLDGESLAQRVLGGGPLPVKEAAEIAIYVLDALAVVHEAGIVHRDLKPDNVFLAVRVGAGGHEKSVVKLLDFGISKLRPRAAGQARLTRTGSVMGTPAYMSPEQAAGRKDLDHRTDIYAVGVILYEVLTGRLPFPGDTYNEVLAAVLTAELKPPRDLRPDLPPKLDAAIRRALARDPNRRFASALDMLKALEPFAPASVVPGMSRSRSGRSTTQTAVGTPEAQPVAAGGARLGRRDRRVIAVAAAVALLLVGTAAVLNAVLGKATSGDGAAPSRAAPAITAPPVVAAVPTADPRPPTAELPAVAPAAGGPSTIRPPTTARVADAGRGVPTTEDAAGPATVLRDRPTALEVRRAFEGIRGVVRACIGREIATVNAGVVFAGPTGRPTSADAVGDFPASPGVAQCVRNALLTLRVEPFANASQEVRHSFSFDQPSAAPGRDAGTLPRPDQEYPE
ncbi:MAG: protein kinase [Myxococcota bacterium]|nr:protein kinase [Myxococcota bacterium]